MPAVCVYGDNAGGSIIATATNVFIHGKKVALIGDQVTSHGKGAHGGAVMVGGSSKVFVNGKGVVRTGDAASCGDIATSSISDVIAG